MRIRRGTNTGQGGVMGREEWSENSWWVTSPALAFIPVSHVTFGWSLHISVLTLSNLSAGPITVPAFVL